MSRNQLNKNDIFWTRTQKIAFRIFFLYILILCIPWYPQFYKSLFNLDLSNLNYHNIQGIVAFWPPQFVLIESEEGVFGLLNYINLIIALVLAIVGGLIWTVVGKDKQNYSNWYYWINVLARYRLAYGMVGWGLKKAFPMQMVKPTIGMLNTSFADFAEKKLYWSHVGVSFDYTVFLGFAEIIPGLLLLHRKSAVLGAALAAVVTFNICIANHAYDAGVSVPAAYFAIIGIFAAWYDLPKIWNLLVSEKDVAPYRYYPTLSSPISKYTAKGIKYSFNFIFVILATYLWGYGFFNGNNYNIPSTKGIENTAGLYSVDYYSNNGVEIPYSPSDSLRWHDVIFEEWSSLSYTTNRPAIVDRMIGYSPVRVKAKKQSRYNQPNTQDSDRFARLKKNRDLGVTRWEVGGMKGDRRYFFYQPDSLSNTLYLQNKNRAHKDETQVLALNFEDRDKIKLSGINEFGDSIQVYLNKIDKNYPLIEGRKSPIKNY